MRRAFAMVFADKVDLQVALFWQGAQIIVAHQAVEVKGRRRAGIGLN